ncbi:MAG: tyrosine-type recombinase/integrase [Candidatus Limnocylindrales bacterium]|jgi:integrase
MAERITKPRRRVRGEGSIYQAADGRWRGAVVVTDPTTGLRDRRLVSAATFALARDRLAELKRDIASGVGAKGAAKTLSAYVEQTWLPNIRLRVRPSTARAHEQHLKDYILPALGALKLREITPSGVERLMGTILKKGRSASTARAVRTTLGQVFHDAQRDGLIVRNAASLARPPRVERRELRILTAAETHRMIEGMAGEPLGPLFCLAATTGLRLGELLGLAWPDVELDGTQPTLTVRRSLARAEGRNVYALAEPKTNRSRRTIELGPTAARALRRQKARQAEDRLAAGDVWQEVASLVFRDSIGRPLAPWDVSKSFAAALKRLELPHVRFHDLRHGAASLLLGQGVPLRLVSEQLGHSSIAITADVYSHIDREQKRASADALERAIGSTVDRP